MKAIETLYKGYRFRSRLEARWAIFFDALGIKWDYELEGYELKNGMKYLPDFWLPEQNIFVEIKGERPTEEEREKARSLAKESGKRVLIFWGNVGEYPGDCALVFGDREDNCYGWHKPSEEWARTGKALKWDVIYAEGNYIDSSGEDEIRHAYEMAHSARFEYGEHG